MTRPQPPSYWDYIRVEQLLSLQGGLGDDESLLSNDEVRFITIHQIDELWMKLALRELQTARDLFELRCVPETSLAAVVAAFRRSALILDLAAQHFRLMETMRPQDYLKFRDKLSPASGFQSAQFRELEIVLGLDDADRLSFGNEASYTDSMRLAGGTDSPALLRVRTRREQATLKDAVAEWLWRTPVNGSSPLSNDVDDSRVVQEFADEYLVCHERTLQELMRTSMVAQALTEADHDRLRQRYQAEIASARRFLAAEDVEDDAERNRRRRIRAAILFIDSNRQLPLLSWPGEVLDALIELEQAFLIFRQRHARMVERIIGRRVGTGGSAGVEYLDQTAVRYRVFKDIWAARTLLVQPELAPPVKNPPFYALRNP